MQSPAPRATSVRSARALLGVAADADVAQVGRAYRRQARLLHPDVSGEPQAVERFQALAAAYHLVLDATAREVEAVAPGAVPVRHRAPQAPLGARVVHGGSCSGARRERASAWLVAGPVMVRPLGHDRAGGPASSSESSSASSSGPSS